MLKLIFTAAIMIALWHTNPPLERFKEALSKKIEEDRSSMRAGINTNQIRRLKPAPPWHNLLETRSADVKPSRV